MAKTEEAEWSYFSGKWCSCIPKKTEFVAASPDELDWIKAAQLVCELENYKGFSSGGEWIYFIHGPSSAETCEAELEPGFTETVYTYWQSTSGRWDRYDGFWHKHAVTDVPFTLANVSTAAADAAAKLICKLKEHSGFSYGGKNFFFIPGVNSFSTCESQLEPGHNERVYTCLRTEWHALEENFSMKEDADDEEEDIVMVTQANQ